MIEIDSVQPNKSSALVALGLTTMTNGELYKVKYLNSFGQVDCLVALGIGEGVGPDYYTIISDGGEFLVTRVVSSLPDISEAVFGAVFLLVDDSGIYRCHLSEEGEWKKEKVKGDHVVSVSADSGKYFISGGQQIQGFSSESSSIKIVTDKNTYIVPVPFPPYIEKEDGGYYGYDATMIGVWDE